VKMPADNEGATVQMEDFTVVELTEIN
jgi:hypothetical protein